MTDLKPTLFKMDPVVRDSRISRKARTARRLEKLAKVGTDADKQAARKAQRDRDAYIDTFAGEP